MTLKSLCCTVLLVGAPMLAVSRSEAQIKMEQSEFAVTYTAERAKIAPSNCGCFWLNGGSADAAVTLFHGLGIAANVTGDNASNITANVNLSKLSFVAGPRYTFSTARVTDRFMKKYPTQIFVEALFGEAHAFDSVFPQSSGAVSTANSFSDQIGGGVDIGLFKGLGLRLFEVDYIHTSLPNNGSNSQNDLRLAFGVSYILRKR